MPPITKITLQDPQTKEIRLQKYPVVYRIANDNTVTIGDAELSACFDEDYIEPANGDTVHTADL